VAGDLQEPSAPSAAQYAVSCILQHALHMLQPAAPGNHAALTSLACRLFQASETSQARPNTEP
jgi:hypothetical protein